LFFSILIGLIKSLSFAFSPQQLKAQFLASGWWFSLGKENHIPLFVDRRYGPLIATRKRQAAVGTGVKRSRRFSNKLVALDPFFIRAIQLAMQGGLQNRPYRQRGNNSE